MGATFEERIDVIRSEIFKRKKKWFLSSVTIIDFEDVYQIILTHIYRKWDQWDQSRPLEPWLNRIISNQIKNLVRNNYGVFAKPCLSCPFNESKGIAEQEACSFTASGTQCEECPLFRKWARNKRQQLHIEIPDSIEGVYDIKTPTNTWVDLEGAEQRIHENMKKRLSPKQFRAYELLIMKNISDDDAAKALGFKTSEDNRKAGYRQIKNYKRLFLNLAKKILQEEDILNVK